MKGDLTSRKIKSIELILGSRNIYKGINSGHVVEEWASFLLMLWS